MAEFLMSERLPIVAAIDPSNSATTQFSDAVDMKKYRRIMAIVQVGAFGTAGTADAEFEGGATSTGAWSTVFASKAITQLTEAGSDDNKQVVLNLSDAEVAATTKRWVRLKMTMGGTTNYCNAVILGWKGKYTEAYTSISYGDLSSVDEIVE